MIRRAEGRLRLPSSRFLAASLAALLLLPLPLSRARVLAPVARDTAMAAAPAAQTLALEAERWPHARPAQAAPRRTLSAADATALSDALWRARGAFGVYGAQMAVSIDGREWSAAVGVTRDGRTRLSATTPQVIGSVTKTFTAATVLLLAEQGLVRLDQPVTAYVPEAARIARGVTVRELLNHTSGVADLYPPLAASLVSQPNRTWTPAQVLSRIGPAWFAPGRDWGYSNTNYVLLGLLIERVTGQPAGEVLRSRIFTPLGLDATRLMVGTDRPPALVDASWASAFWTAGAVRSTAGDLVRWADALYGGDVLSAADLRDMLTFNSDDYGLGARRLTLAGHAGYGHTGMLATYSAIVVRLPAEGITLSLITNRSKVDVASMLTARIGGHPSLLDVALAARR